MLSKGDILYLPISMAIYRVGQLSIHAGANLTSQRLNAMIASEINMQILPRFKNILHKRYHERLYEFAWSFITRETEFAEKTIFSEFALKHECVMAYTALNWEQLDLKEKISFILKTIWHAPKLGLRKINRQLRLVQSSLRK